MTGKRDKLAVGQRLMTAFREAGAVEVTPDILLPAETLLDLYGEDIRARAYLTDDPLRGEVALRPDFTVPVVQMHMESGAEPARYCYLGEIFRKQDPGDTRPEHPRDNEYLQAGFELFSRDTDADATVFALFHRLLDPYALRPMMGDMGLLMQAVRALPLPVPRRDALLHHIWRPRRFAALVQRFSAPSPARAFPTTDAPLNGVRGMDEIRSRLDRLAADADAAPLPAEWAEWLTRLFAVAGPAPDAIDDLGRLVADVPQLQPALDQLIARLDAIAAHGIDTGRLLFDASHGRQTMEYYDGLTFSFVATDQPDWPPIASGGRYDALTAQLGAGRAIPAVGGIIRPGLIAELEASTC